MLTVGVNLPSEGFQVGAKGRTVVFAQGLDRPVRAHWRRSSSLRRAVFVQSRFDQLLSAGPKPFDMAVAQITVTKARRKALDFSVPYMRADQGVLLSQTGGHGAAHDRRVSVRCGLCALAHSTGAALVRERIRPVKPPRADRQRGDADALVADRPLPGGRLRRAIAGHAPRHESRQRSGAFAGVIRDEGGGCGIAFPKGSPLSVFQ